ncbi:50S ribosomal protein L4 [Candidatus Parabeggiatoa sp. HSG14]|uniref:50S ribosomal protein L4 n=1 Tax=Candidatus Parabeggiatoa sp. HSG14 TaxID=3055593 RepID=UPI0025A887D4|nr:50S ribosomal protein L4 [Thiotrichales bacterium HSG14]
MELSLQTLQDDTTLRVVVAKRVFTAKFNQPLVHQAVIAYLAGKRAGTCAQKSRAQVRGSHSKPWRQKGTGRARAGTRRSPLWRGGGVTFAAKPTNYNQKINKKMYREALRAILSEQLRQARLLLIEQLFLDKPKTKELLTKLKALNLNNVLIVTEILDTNLYLAARNLLNVEVIEVKDLNPISLLGFDKILLTLPALKKIEEQLA